MRLSERALFSAEEIQARVREMATEISRDYAGRELVLLVVLKGALPFAADLMRRLSVPVRVEFVRAKSYRGTSSTRTVEITVHPEETLKDKSVLIVEDILDTGYTTAALFDRFMSEHPADIALCAMFDKPARRETNVEAKYVGFPVDDHFVVGYGLDYDERYRELPELRVLEP